ncbi:MAG TPA: LacI family DNA-binding transcriptional regulator [Acidobacteriaceae bacterium]|nr:LacI family DNA-binding transcriptional regulator [Acidobacteriaceae bacterium]
MKEGPPQRRAGIRQIADALGISIGSVDRALHNRAGVSPRTRDRVLKMAQKLNYAPNLAARNLKLNRHIRIGVFLPEQIACFFNPLRAGIRSACRDATSANIDLSFYSFPHLGEGDVECLERNHWENFDGTIIAPGNPARLNGVLGVAESSRKPVVFVATDAHRLHRLSSVAVESSISGSIAAELLGQIIREPRPVAVLTGDLKVQDHSEKLRGFAAGLALHAPHLTLLPAIESHDSPEHAYRGTLNLLESNPALGGMYISTANSISVIRAVEKSGRLGEIRIIATDLFPELSQLIEAGQVFASLVQRPHRQGWLAFEILSQYLITGKVPRRNIRLAPHIALKSNLILLSDSMAAEESTDPA